MLQEAERLGDTSAVECDAVGRTVTVERCTHGHTIDFLLTEHRDPAGEILQQHRGARHRAVQRVTRPVLGCKACEAAQATLGGITLIPMIKKQQLVVAAREEGLMTDEKFSYRDFSSFCLLSKLTSYRLHVKMCTEAGCRLAPERLDDPPDLLDAALPHGGHQDRQVDPGRAKRGELLPAAGHGTEETGRVQEAVGQRRGAAPLLHLGRLHRKAAHPEQPLHVGKSCVEAKALACRGVERLQVVAEQGR